MQETVKKVDGLLDERLKERLKEKSKDTKLRSTLS